MGRARAFAAVTLALAVAPACLERAFRVDAAEDLERAVCRCETTACATALVDRFEQDLSRLDEASRRAIAESEVRMRACVDALRERDREASTPAAPLPVPSSTY